MENVALIIENMENLLISCNKSTKGLHFNFLLFTIFIQFDRRHLQQMHEFFIFLIRINN